MITRTNKKQCTASKGPTLGPTTEEHLVLVRCSGCPRTFTSARGLRQHISQSKTCSSATLNAIETTLRRDTTQQQTEDEENNPATAEEIDEERGSLSSIHENARLFGDTDNESEVDEDEIEIRFDIEAQDELLNAHEPQDDTVQHPTLDTVMNNLRKSFPAPFHNQSKPL
eukprot:scaffold12534_cov63-Attheya_sp.AAC.3